MQEYPYVKRLFLMHGKNMCHKIVFKKKRIIFMIEKMLTQRKAHNRIFCA